MERITFYDDFGKPCYRIKQYSEVHGGYVDTIISNSDVARKLAAYEDAKEQGRLVVLPCSGKEFEAICESVHNAWWDEKKKQGIFDHPDAIPYDQLSEEVKEYDRVTVRAVLMALQALARESALAKTNESEVYNES